MTSFEFSGSHRRSRVSEHVRAATGTVCFKRLRICAESQNGAARMGASTRESILSTVHLCVFEAVSHHLALRYRRTASEE